MGATTPSRSSKIAPSSSNSSIKKRPRSSIYDHPSRLLSDQKSPIYKDNINLKAILQHPLAIQTFLKAGKEFPFSSLNSDDFASAVAAFKEDGRCGRHNPEWVRQAMEASERRRNGEFDKYIKTKFKETWGVDWGGQREEHDEENDVDELGEDCERPLSRHDSGTVGADVIAGSEALKPGQVGESCEHRSEHSKRPYMDLENDLDELA